MISFAFECMGRASEEEGFGLIQFETQLTVEEIDGVVTLAGNDSPTKFSAIKTHHLATIHTFQLNSFCFPTSLGLIRARLAGARLAKADTLVFLDAHCECVVQWLEPLMERIKEKSTSVLVPIIDVIEAKNFYYSTNGYDTFQVSSYAQTL
jgi:polypeptide N-acetylgalactosaminyltransferase